MHRYKNVSYCGGKEKMARRNSRQASPGMTIVIGIIMIVISVAMFTIGNSVNNMRKRCTESTKGVVQTVREERRTKKSGKHRRVTYYVYVTGYEFDVNGSTYSGSSTLSQSDRLNVGATLTVHYNSDKPAEEHYSQYDSSGTGGIFFSVFMALFGLVFTGSGIKRKLSGGMGVRQAIVGAAMSGGFNNNNNYNSYNNNGYNNNNYNNNYSNNNYSYNNSYSSNGYNNDFNQLN